MTIFSWQSSDYQKLAQRAERLPHALLFIGMGGIGKSHLCKRWPKACCANGRLRR